MKEEIRRKLKRLIENSKKAGRVSRSPKYITAYDPKIKRRVVHIVVRGTAISLVTGNKFRYTEYG